MDSSSSLAMAEEFHTHIDSTSDTNNTNNPLPLPQEQEQGYAEQRPQDHEQEQEQDHEDWHAVNVVVPMYESVTSTEVVNVDIASLLAKDISDFRGRSQSFDTAPKYWFDPKYNSCESTDRPAIVSMLCRACRSATISTITSTNNHHHHRDEQHEEEVVARGFNLIVTQTQNRRDLFFTMRLSCERGQLPKYAPNDRRKSQRQTRTHKPESKDHICKFSLNIAFCKTNQRWFLKKTGAGCSQHNHHPPLPAHLLRTRTAILDPDTLQLVADQLILNTPVESINTLLTERNNNGNSSACYYPQHFSRQQLANVRKHVMKKKGAYKYFHPQFATMMNDLVKTDAEFEIVKRKLDEMHQSLLACQEEKKQQQQLQGPITASTYRYDSSSSSSPPQQQQHYLSTTKRSRHDDHQYSYY